MSVHHQDEYLRLSRPASAATPLAGAELAVVGWVLKCRARGPEDSISQLIRRGAVKAIERAERSGADCARLREILQETSAGGLCPDPE